MAAENTAPETETETSAPAADQTTAVPEATGDEGQHALDLPAVEGDDAPKLEGATGELSTDGEQASVGTEQAPAEEADPTLTTEAPAAPADLGTSESPIPVAEDSVDQDVASLDPAGPDEAAPEQTLTPEAEAPAAEEAAPAADPTASSVDAPAEAAPAPDQDISTSTGIGGDKAADVEPAEEPKLDPAPAPSISQTSLFDHGKPVVIPEISVPSDQGFPIAQPNATPVHPQHFGELVNDGVLDDAGKVAGPTEYSADPAPTEVDDSEEGDENVSHDIAAEPAEEPDAAPAGEPSAVPPHVEGRLAQLFDKIGSMEAKIAQLCHELLD